MDCFVVFTSLKLPRNDSVKKSSLQGALDEILDALNFSGEIAFVDENLSSIEAQSHINGRKKSKKLRKDGTLDSLSAMIILERYLNAK